MMFNVKNSKVFDNKVTALIDKAGKSDSKETDDALIAKHAKEEMFAAIGRLNVNNNELMKWKEENKVIGEQNMDDKDMQLLKVDIKNILTEEFKDKFNGLENDLKGIKENSEQACTDGKCLTDKFEDFEKNFEENFVKKFDEKFVNKFDERFENESSNIASLKEDVTGFKSGIEEKIGTLTESISEIKDKTDETCTGIDCINKRFEKEDDMVKCPECKTLFSLSENTLGDKIICPNCGTKLE